MKFNLTDFIKQEQHLEAFITGPAGSGKTTKLKEIVEEAEKLKLNYLVVAYTHKAKDVLISKLPEGTVVRTLHSWLKKRPGINEKAKHLKTLMTNHQVGKPEHLQLLIVDEFSFVGEKDYFSIGELQDELILEDLPGKPKPLKVLYVGDLNQLSPVNDTQVIFPLKPFWEELTYIHRTTTTISKPLGELVEMIEGDRDQHYLEPTEHFIREQDIDALYLQDTNPDKIMLAYTNKAVQAHNILIQGYSEPKKGDVIYNSTLKREFTLVEILNKYEGCVLTPRGEIDSDTKYNPLKFLNSNKAVKFYVTEEGPVLAGIFGTYTNKLIREEVGKKLVTQNQKGENSKSTFREYKNLNDYVSILDFNHCMTIHKSQGSEYDNVYIDSIDLSICFDTQEKMKLLYVAMSRAKNKILLNN